MADASRMQLLRRLVDLCDRYVALDDGPCGVAALTDAEGREVQLDEEFIEADIEIDSSMDDNELRQLAWEELELIEAELFREMRPLQ